MHITHVCPRFKEVHGGGEPVLLNLFRELSLLGVRHTLYTYDMPQSMQAALTRELQLKNRLGLFNRDFKNVLLAGLYDLFRSGLLGFQINDATDVVCFYTENTIPALFAYTLFGGKKPTLYFCFQPPRFAYDTAEATKAAGGRIGQLMMELNHLYKRFDLLAVQKADRILTFSQGYCKWIEDLYGVNEVGVHPPGVALPDRIPDLPAAIKTQLTGETIRTLVFVGKLVNWKNLDRLLKIIHILKPDLPGIRCLIVGDGPARAHLTRMTQALGLTEHIIFCGYVAADQTFAYTRASDLLVLLEQNASFGLCLIEANKVGIPVIAFEGGGPSDIVINGQNGILLSRTATNQEIAGEILTLFGQPERLAQMKAASLIAADQYTWQGFAAGFLAEVQRMV